MSEPKLGCQLIPNTLHLFLQRLWLVVILGGWEINSYSGAFGFSPCPNTCQTTFWTKKHCQKLRCSLSLSGVASVTFSKMQTQNRHNISNDSYVRKCRDRSGKAVGAKVIHQWNGIEKKCFDFRTVYHSHFGQEPPLGHHQCKELISETKKPYFLSPVSVMTVLNFQICLYTKGLTQDKKTAVYRKEQGGISED